MKIAIVTAGGADPGATHDVIPCLLWFIERLAGSGDDVHVFCLYHGKEVGTWPLLGATVHNAGGSRYLFRLFRQIVTEHRRAPFDVIHTLWSPRANLTAVAAAKILQVPVLLYFGAGELAAISDIGFGRQLTCKGRLWLRFAAAGADRVGAQSDYIVREARARNVPAERMALGVALDRWPAAPPRRRIAGNPARLLHVANVIPKKDHGMLLEAASLLRIMGVEFELDLIGIDVAGNGAIIRRAAELGLADRIRFHGFLPHHAMREYFDGADIHIVTSRHEAGPLVVYEAAIAGVPSVGTNVGHLAEMSPMAAHVVEPCDSVGLANAIADLLIDEDARLALADRAQAVALAENADVTSRQFREIYAEMASPPDDAVGARR